MRRFRQIFDLVHFQRHYFQDSMFPRYAPVVVQHNRHVWRSNHPQTNPSSALRFVFQKDPSWTSARVSWLPTFSSYGARSSANQRPTLSVRADERPRHSRRRNEGCRRSTTLSQPRHNPPLHPSLSHPKKIAAPNCHKLETSRLTCMRNVQDQVGSARILVSTCSVNEEEDNGCIARFRRRDVG